MKGKPTKTASSKLTASQKAELDALAELPGDKIDTSDIPEARDWPGAMRGAFYRPIKQQLTLRVDADIVAWFKERTRDGKGYQTIINKALREYVERHAKENAKGL
ncbi:MAG: BrnA antitoxin family protein [Rhodomicrobium sp.]